MAKNKIECPKCNRQPTGKYRDEMRIDGMYCRPCNVAWNVDWENEKPLYETTVDLSIDDYINSTVQKVKIRKRWE